MVSQQQATDQVAFSMSSRVIIQLGRESISDSIIAIIELVKNSYDADAKNIWIDFIGLDQLINGSDEETTNDFSPFIIIEDDGDGMTLNQVTEKWMVIGVDDKVRNPISRNKRTKVGEKGLGRLGLDRLSEKSTLYTFVEGAYEGTRLYIDWTKYEDNSASLDDIKHPIQSTEGLDFVVPYLPPKKISKRNGKGTAIILEYLRDEWNYEYLDKLRQELSLLVSPFSGLNDFQIHLTVDEQPFPISSSEILDAAEWEVTSEITQIEDEWYMIHSMKGRSYLDKEFETTEKWSTIFPEADLAPNCGKLEFFFYFIPRVKISDDDLNFSRREVTEFMNANQGIRIYRDWFHVKPYGDPDGSIGDWLGLSYRKTSNPASRRSGGWRVQYNQTVGAIFIERDRNTALTDQTNREGIVHGDAYSDLKRYALHVISWFEENDYQAYLDDQPEDNPADEAEEELNEASDEADESINELENTVTDAFDKMGQDLQQGKPPDIDLTRNMLLQAAQKAKKKSERNRKAQKKYVATTKESTEDLERRTDYLANLASLGILSVAFGHETLARVNLVVQNADLLYGDINDLSDYVPNNIREISEQVQIIQKNANHIQLFAKFMLKNVRRDKRSRVSTQLADLVKDIFAVFQENLVIERNINIQLMWDDDPPNILAFAIDWESIFVNLITNSIYALERISQKDRIIRVKMDFDNNFMYIKFADSGSGLEIPENWKDSDVELFFRANVSTKRFKDGEVYGTGMGLFIIRQLLQKHYDGEISAVPKCDLGGAEFTIKIPIPDLEGRGKRKEHD